MIYGKQTMYGEVILLFWESNDNVLVFTDPLREFIGMIWIL